MKPSRPTDAQLVALLRRTALFVSALADNAPDYSPTREEGLSLKDGLRGYADALEAASAPDVRTFEQKVSHADEAAWESYRATRPWIRAYHELSPRDIMLRKQSTREMLRAAGCGEG